MMWPFKSEISLTLAAEGGKDGGQDAPRKQYRYCTKEFERQYFYKSNFQTLEINFYWNNIDVKLGQQQWGMITRILVPWVLFFLSYLTTHIFIPVPVEIGRDKSSAKHYGSCCHMFNSSFHSFQSVYSQRSVKKYVLGHFTNEMDLKIHIYDIVWGTFIMVIQKFQ